MLEVLLIMSIVYAFLYMPMRGKTLEQLSPKQLKRAEKNYNAYMKTKKGKKTPDMKLADYLPVIQKQGLTYLIMAIVILPIYILVVAFYYSTMFAV